MTTQTNVSQEHTLKTAEPLSTSQSSTAIFNQNLQSQQQSQLSQEAQPLSTSQPLFQLSSPIISVTDYPSSNNQRHRPLLSVNPYIYHNAQLLKDPQHHYHTNVSLNGQSHIRTLNHNHVTHHNHPANPPQQEQVQIEEKDIKIPNWKEYNAEAQWLWRRIASMIKTPMVLNRIAKIYPSQTPIKIMQQLSHSVYKDYTTQKTKNGEYMERCPPDAPANQIKKVKRQTKRTHQRRFAYIVEYTQGLSVPKKQFYYWLFNYMLLGLKVIVIQPKVLQYPSDITRDNCPFLID